MIERRRLFLTSDFLRDIAKRALFREVLCSLAVHYQETMESCAQAKPVSQRPAQNRMVTQTGLIETRLLELVLFATFALMTCYVYQINWNRFRWGHAFRRKRSRGELGARRCR